MEVRKSVVVAATIILTSLLLVLIIIVLMLVQQQVAINKLLNERQAEQVVIIQPTVNLPAITRIPVIVDNPATYTPAPTYTPVPTYTPMPAEFISTTTPEAYIYSTVEMPTLAPQRPPPERGVGTLGEIGAQQELTSTSEIWLTTKQVLIDFGIWDIMQSGIAIFFVIAIVMILLKFFRA